MYRGNKHGLVHPKTTKDIHSMLCLPDKRIKSYRIFPENILTACLNKCHYLFKRWGNCKIKYPPALPPTFSPPVTSSQRKRESPPHL